MCCKNKQELNYLAIIYIKFLLRATTPTPIIIESKILFVLYIQTTIREMATNPANPSFNIDGTTSAKSSVEGRYSRNTFTFSFSINLLDNSSQETLNV